MRLFIAYCLSGQESALLGGYCEKQLGGLRQHGWALGRVCPENFHITLHFIGELEEGEALQALTNQLTRIAAQTQPMALNFSELSFLPSNRQPRVLAVQSDQASPDWDKLVRRVAAACKQQPAVSQGHRAHITLVRIKKAGQRSAMEDLAQPPALPVSMSCMHLVQSLLKEGGPKYETIATFAFSGAEI